MDPHDQDATPAHDHAPSWAPPPPPAPGSPPDAVCYRHPDRPTRLSCSTCGRPTCVDCTTQAAVGQKCPECAKPTGRSRVITARQVRGEGMLDGAPVTKAIVGVSVVLAILALVAPAIWRELAVVLVDDVRAVEAGEWWRVVSGALLHSPTFIWHIAFNMWALVVFGPQIERRAGSVPFLLLYIAAAAAGGVAFQAFREVGSATGASGAVFGLFGVHLMAAVLARRTVAGRAGLRQLGPLLAINLALPLFVPNIAWEAHLGGLVAGALIMALWARLAPIGRLPREGQRSQALVRAAIAAGVLVACFLILPLV